MTLGELLVKIKIDKGDTDSAISSVGSSLKNLNVLGIASAAAIGATLVKALSACVDAAAEAEQATTRLNAIIKSTGGVAGVTSRAALELAGSLQEVTTFDDEAIVGGQTLLLTFTKIGKDIFPKATEAMLDMAELMGGDLKSAAIQIGKALQDPIQGVSALRRVGIQLSQAQTDQIQKFMELNDVASAQKVVLGELNTQMGGIARAAADTYTGRMKQMSNAFGELKETIGGILLPLAKFSAELGTNFLKGANTKILEFIAGIANVREKIARAEYEAGFLSAKQYAEVWKEAARAKIKALGGTLPGEEGKAKPSTDLTKEAIEANQKRQDAFKQLEEIYRTHNAAILTMDSNTNELINQQQQAANEKLRETGLQGTAEFEQAKETIRENFRRQREQADIQSNQRITQMAVSSMQQMVSGLSAVFNQYMTNKNIALDNEQFEGQERINSEYEIEKARIENTVIDEREKAAQLKALDEKKARDTDKLNKKIEKDKRKAAREAAQIQKAIAISTVAVQTAQGIAAAWATAMQLGPYAAPFYGAAMTAMLTALAATQTALIAAQPLPAAAQGGVFNTPYIGGEAGTEMAVPLTGSQGQTAIQALASGMLDVMSQAVDTRATVSSASAGATGGGGDVYLDGSLVGQWISRGSNNGMFSINKKVVVS